MVQSRILSSQMNRLYHHLMRSKIALTLTCLQLNHHRGYFRNILHDFNTNDITRVNITIR